MNQRRIPFGSGELFERLRSFLRWSRLLQLYSGTLSFTEREVATWRDMPLHSESAGYRCCQNRESTNFGAIELDVYAVNGGILRYARSLQLYEDYLSGLGRNLHGPIA